MRMPNGEYGRCRMHGGAAAVANWKHGLYAAQTRAEAAEVAEMIRVTRELLAQLQRCRLPR